MTDEMRASTTLRAAWSTGEKMTDEMRASILAHINMVNVVAPLLSKEALQKFVREEQRRIEQEKKQQHRGDGTPR